MTASLDITAASTPKDVRAAPGAFPNRRYSLQWQTSGSDVLKLRESETVPNTSDDAMLVAPGSTIAIVTSTQHGIYAWSAGGGKVVIS